MPAVAPLDLSACMPPQIHSRATEDWEVGHGMYKVNIATNCSNCNRSVICAVQNDAECCLENSKPCQVWIIEWSMATNTTAACGQIGWYKGSWCTPWAIHLWFWKTSWHCLETCFKYHLWARPLLLFGSQELDKQLENDVDCCYHDWNSSLCPRLHRAVSRVVQAISLSHTKCSMSRSQASSKQPAWTFTSNQLEGSQATGLSRTVCSLSAWGKRGLSTLMNLLDKFRSGHHATLTPHKRDIFYANHRHLSVSSIIRVNVVNNINPDPVGNVLAST